MSLTELKSWAFHVLLDPEGVAQRCRHPWLDITAIEGLLKWHLPVSLWAEVADEVTRPEQGPCVSAEGR